MIAEQLNMNIDEIRDPNSRIRFIELGFTKDQLNRLKNIIHVSSEKFALLLGASVKTIQRISENSKTNLNISESVVDLIDIYEVGLELYNTPEDVTEFMETVNPFLNDKRPMDLCKTATGRQLVYTYLNQIKYGIMA